MPIYTFRVSAGPHRSTNNHRTVTVEPAKGPQSHGAGIYAALLDYNPDTGELTRLTGPNRYRTVSVHNRSGTIKVSGIVEKAADVAWLLYTGHRPTGRVYPVNGHVTDLRICNLRMEVIV